MGYWPSCRLAISQIRAANTPHLAAYTLPYLLKQKISIPVKLKIRIFNLQSMKTILRTLLLAFACAFIIVVQGCAAIFHTRHCALVTQQDSTQVNINEGGMWTSGFNNGTTVVRGRVAEAKLDNRNDYYLIKQSAKGYLPSVTMIDRGKFNAGKAIDLLLPAISDLYILSIVGSQNSGSNNNNTTANPFPLGKIAAWYMGTAGWLDIAFGPWKMYGKTYKLPALIPLPVHSKEENRIYVKDAGVDIKKDSLVRTYYSTYKKYVMKRLLYTSSEQESFKYTNTEFQDTLNSALAQWGYIDTSAGLFSRMYNSAYYLKCKMYNLSINTVGSVTFINAKCNWMLYGTTDENALFTASISSTSNWGDFTEDEYGYGAFIGDALKKGMVEFISSPQVQKYLHDKSAVKNTMAGWKTIDFNAPQYAGDLEDAIKSVVTVKVPEGHGSGCIVSADGYLITNYHVISEDTSNTVDVYMNNGDTLKADYVRSNSTYDLALLKLEKPGNYLCFSPSLSKNITVGEEVYAIGTPEDLSLGQSITKGIISGKRKVHDKTVIQTDVSINPGNSGGALVTKDGVLLGIVSAKLIGNDIQSIGFAIPSSYIEDALKVKFTSSK